MDRPRTRRVDEAEVGVVAGSDAAFGRAESVPVCRVQRRELGDAAVGKAATRSLANESGQQVLSAAEAGLGREDVVTVRAELRLLLAAGMVTYNPVDVSG